jgi:hypothetical protein
VGKATQKTFPNRRIDFKKKSNICEHSAKTIENKDIFYHKKG